MDTQQEKAYLQEWLETANNMAQQNFNADQSDEDVYPHGFSLQRAHSESDTEIASYSETSSSSDSEIDELSTGLMDSQTHQGMLRRKKRVSFKDGVEELPEKVTPDWFENQGFQYSGRVFVVALPGFCMVLALGGDMFLTVITLGAFAVHLFKVTGSANKTFIAYMIVFICTQLTVLYSAIPLLWQSLINAVLIVAINMYGVLTGLWLMLFFNDFLQREPELAKFIETSLFSLYPAVSTVLVSWVVASMTSMSVAPYCLLVVGFGLFQVFLTPTQSSFIKVSSVPTEESYILNPDLTAAVALLYCTGPTCLFLVTNLSADFWAATQLTVLAEAAFLACLSTFLTTYLSWRPFMDKSGLPLENLQRIRWMAGLATLLLLGVVLHCWGVQSQLLPWLPVILGLHALLAVFFIRKHGRVVLMCTVVAGSIFYAIVIMQLPWLVDYYIQGSLHLNMLYLLLLANGVLCLSCVYTASYSSPDLFGLTFLLQSLSATMLEKSLLTADLVPFSYTVLISAFIIYVIDRLSRSSKLPWQHSLLSLSVQLGTLLTTVSALRPAVTPPSSLWKAGYEFVGAWSLMACLVQGLWFEARPLLSRKQLAIYLFSWLIVGMLNAELMGQLISTVTLHVPSVTEIAALLVFITGAMGLKLTTCHQCDWPYGKSVSIVTMVTGLLVLCIHPSGAFHWEDITTWLAILSLLFGIGGLSTIKKVKVTVPTILVVAMLIGAPLGLGAPLLIYRQSVVLPVYLPFIAVITLCIDLSLAVWLLPGTRDRNIKTILLIQAIACGAGFVFTLMEPVDNLRPQPGFMAACIGALGSAVILKLQSLWSQVGHMTSQGDLYISKIPLWGNIATCASFVLLVIICPISEWHAWVCLCSQVWFLLQRDNVLIRRKSRDSHWAPTALTVVYSLFIMTLYNSGFWTSKNISSSLLGLMEISIVVLTVPTYVILTSVLLSGTVIMSDKWVVFLMPLNFVLLLIATSYTCHFHAICGITFCLWLMRFRLELKVTR